MILDRDTIALVKRYVAEPGTAEVAQAMAGAEAIGTSIIARAEMAAALARAVRTGLLGPEPAASALQVFRSDWPRLVRVQATELLIARAEGLGVGVARLCCGPPGGGPALARGHGRAGDLRHL